RLSSEKPERARRAFVPKSLMNASHSGPTTKVCCLPFTRRSPLLAQRIVFGLYRRSRSPLDASVFSPQRSRRSCCGCHECARLPEDSAALIVFRRRKVSERRRVRTVRTL